MNKSRFFQRTLQAIALILFVFGVFLNVEPSQHDLIFQKQQSDESILHGFIRQSTGLYIWNEADIRSGVYYRKRVVLPDGTIKQAGQTALCGELSTVNLLGVHLKYRRFVSSIWFSRDGMPLPDPEHEISGVVIDDSRKPQIHDQFKKRELVDCKDEVLPTERSK